MTTIRSKTRAERQAELMAQTRQTPDVPDVPAQLERREPTASEQLQALRERRQRANGPIVPRPTSLTLDSMRKWLRQIAEFGSPGDVEIGWHAVNDVRLKERLLNEYERIKAIAGSRYAVLADAARQEQERERAEWRRRAAASNLAKEIQHDQARLAEKRRRLAEAG